ncbi:MAG TPA: pyridoxamine 5'-phosphate oxidase family protein [Anaerolineae bacterium]|nr:pyridoxamine 5'-phosphate oxidase family protein [Anaerolineae bacterium]
MQDEPILGSEFDTELGKESSDQTVSECIRALVAEELFAVLCTQGEGQPYGSVVAFAFSHDLTSFVFATPKATRKFRLLSGCDRVALVVDNRGKFPGDLMKVGAVTITGKALQIEPGPDFEGWARLLTARHPYLKLFIEAPSTALFRVNAVRFLHVTRFQEVRQWIPASNG